MGYKYKPMKGALKRFKFSKTGKVKRRHSLSTHLRSGRPSNKKRALRRPAVLSETLAGNIRRFVGLAARNPNRTAHQRRLKEIAAKKAEAAAKK